MKNTAISIFLIFICYGANAQAFGESLLDALAKFESADSLQRKIEALNRIDLIKSKWPGEWTVHYYSAYTKTVISYLLADELHRDAMLDQAEESLAEAERSGGLSRDEFLIMEAYVASARIAVKSGSRWKRYGAVFDARLEEAKQIAPRNPRIYFLKGQSLYYTPKAFGGGAKKALPYFEKAAIYFQDDEPGKLEKPFWGNTANSRYIRECKQ